MSLARSRFLDPGTLSGIKDLRLVARTIVEGFLAGLHLDPRPGAGVEFSQYRSYQPGDDVRLVDWQVFARSDRYYIRESEVERDVVVRLLLDASRSMAHVDGRLSKFDYARFVAAALVYLVDLQGDQIRFHAVRDTPTTPLAVSRRQRMLELVLHSLERLEPEGKWPSWDALGGMIARSRNRELVILISDLHEKAGEIRQALNALRTQGHEALVLHLLGRNELEFDYTGDLGYEDLETGETVRGNAERMRGAYLKRLRIELDNWRHELLGMGVAYEVLPTDQPVERALRSFLAQRRRMP